VIKFEKTQGIFHFYPPFSEKTGSFVQNKFKKVGVIIGVKITNPL